MKVQYNFDQTRRFEGVIDLDPSTEFALLNAETDDERHGIIDPIVTAHAAETNDFVYSRTVDFCIE